MVSGQNLKVIAPHLLSCTHLCLDGCQHSQDPQSFNPWLGLDSSSYSHYRIWPRQVALICYHLELKVLVFSINQLRFIKEKC